jgi:hypothetical protein
MELELPDKESIALSDFPLSHKDGTIVTQLDKATAGGDDAKAENERGFPANTDTDSSERLGEVQGVQSPTYGIGAAEAGDPAVRAEQRPVRIRSSQGAESIISGRQFYGKTNAQHGVHMPPPAPAAYTCEDCLDLERRVRKTFKEMGFEF